MNAGVRGWQGPTMTALVLAVGLGTPGSVASAMPVVVPSLPKCSIVVMNVDGVRAKLRVLDGGAIRTIDLGYDFPFTPKAFTLDWRAWVTPTQEQIVFLATDATSGELWRIGVTGIRSGNTITYGSPIASVVGRSWAGVRVLARSGPYLYALTDSGGLFRYAFRGKDAIPFGAGSIAISGWGGVKTLAVAPSLPVGVKAISNTGVDVFISETDFGAVMEYRIPRGSPASARGRTMKPAGWDKFAYFATGGCSAPSPSRPLLGIQSTGHVVLYQDVHGGDFSGSDWRFLSASAGGDWRGRFAG